jgi:hypothetical protein
MPSDKQSKLETINPCKAAGCFGCGSRYGGLSVICIIYIYTHAFNGYDILGPFTG